MILRACAFTNTGWEIVKRIETSLEDCLIERKKEDARLDDWVKECFELGLPILFVGAMGIAVRKIAPFVSSKLTDSPVVVIDEAGKYVIPVLSNHLGGANEIAATLADTIEGQLVITTATDVHKIFAIDVFARNNGLSIVNKDGIKNISAKMLESGRIKMAVSEDIEIDASKIPDGIELVRCGDEEADAVIMMPEEYEDVVMMQKKAADVIITTEGTDAAKGLHNAKLLLIYKPYVLGIGCKKDTEFDKLKDFISAILNENGVDISQVSGIASIDLKQKERCILYWQSQNRIPFITFTAEELQSVDGDFNESEFVKQITGVSNVCERSAIRLAGEGAELIVPKVAKDGMTLSVSKRKARIDTWEM